MVRFTQIFLAVVLITSLSACNFPSSSQSPTASLSDLVITSAAQTVAAQLTAMSTTTPKASTTPTLMATTPAPTAPPLPTSGSTITIAPTNTRSAVIGTSTCDAVSFEADVTVPDGSAITAGTTYTKTWRLKNSGSCSWTTGYAFIYVSGDRMGAPEQTPVNREIKPGELYEVSVNLTAPATTGNFAAYFRMRNASGVPFGVPPSNSPIWVKISVPGSGSTATVTLAPTSATSTVTLTPTTGPTPTLTPTFLPTITFTPSTTPTRTKTPAPQN